MAVEIEWIDSTSPRATGNKIYRDTVPSTGEVEIADIANGTQFYSDDTVEPDTDYKFEVQAHDGAGDETTQEVEGENMDYITTASLDPPIDTDAIIAYYGFNDNANDELGVNNGTASGTTYVTGKAGNAIRYAGVNNSGVTIADSGDFTFGNGVTDVPFSITFFFKWNVATSSSQHYLVSKRASGGADNEYALYLYNGVYKLRIYNQGGTDNIDCLVDWVPPIDTWFHLAFTYDGSGATSGLKMYRDGVLIPTSNVETGSYTAMEPTTSQLKFGEPQFVSTGNSEGDMDGMAIWSKELTADEITDIYNKQNSGEELLP